MIIKQIHDFFKQFSNNLLTYKAGFYHIPFFGNSPEAIVKNFKSFPFIDWDKEKSVFNSDNPLLTGQAYYHEIEDGLWLHLSKVSYKANVSYDFYYDDGLPANYFVVSYNIVETVSNSKVVLMNGIGIKSLTWNFCKPKANQKLVYFKGCTSSSLAIYFSEDWIKKKIEKYPLFNESNFKLFFDSLQKIIIWHDPLHEKNNYFQFSKSILSKENSENKNIALKKIVDNTFNYLIKNFQMSSEMFPKGEFKNDIAIKLHKIEKKLIDNLLGDFPGIDFLAFEFDLSPTGLKQKFKEYYGESIYKYYLNKQLEIAMVFLKNKNKKVGEVAKILNYSSEGKFSIAFKNKYGILPSNVEKD